MFHIRSKTTNAPIKGSRVIPDRVGAEGNACYDAARLWPPMPGVPPREDVACSFLCSTDNPPLAPFMSSSPAPAQRKTPPRTPAPASTPALPERKSNLTMTVLILPRGATDGNGMPSGKSGSSVLKLTCFPFRAIFFPPRVREKKSVLITVLPFTFTTGLVWFGLPLVLSLFFLLLLPCSWSTSPRSRRGGHSSSTHPS